MMYYNVFIKKIIFGLLICQQLEISISEVVTLKCDEIERLYEAYNDIFCTVTNLRVTHSQEVKTNSYAEAQLLNIKFMKYYDSSLLYVPHKLFETFPNLKNLDVSYSGIIEISRNAFAAADNLSYLNMSHNNVTEITTSAFVGAEKLLRIDLSNNHITKLSKNTFKGLYQLDRIIISNNHITELAGELFEDNVILESVALDNNQIETINASTFKNLQRLREIDLTNNKISTFSPETFQNAYNLDGVFLAGNSLKNFTLDVSHTLSNIFLENNQITYLKINSTKVLKTSQNNLQIFEIEQPGILEKLYLAKNQLKSLENIMQFVNLAVLDISYNFIGKVNVSFFDNLKRLKFLYLRSTNISGITYGTFSKQSQLEVLDLSYNNLKYLNLDIFVPYMSKLQELFVEGNDLTELGGKTFSYAFPVLTTLGLSKNKFNCSYLHYILTPPYLSTYVKLHIDKETKMDDVPHIRGIACENKEIDINKKFLDPKNPNVYSDNLKVLLLHQQQLETNLMLMKLAVATVVIVAIVLILLSFLKCFKQRNSNLVTSIAFRSTGTVNTTLDQ